MADIKVEELHAVAGYDDDGVATVFQLAAGEKLPKGFHDKPPKGTHPHEREAAAARAAPAPGSNEK